MSIIWSIKFTAKPGKELELQELVNSWADELEELPACEDMQVFKEVDNPACVLSLEVWESKEAHQEYITQVRASGAFDKHSELMSAEPEGHYFELC